MSGRAGYGRGDQRAGEGRNRERQGGGQSGRSAGYCRIGAVRKHTQIICGVYKGHAKKKNYRPDAFLD